MPPSPQAVDRVSTISSEKGRAVKLTLDDGKLTLSVNNPENGTRDEELAVDYGSIRSRSASTRDICSTSPGRSKASTAEFQLADAGSPTMVRDAKRSVGPLRADADAGVRASRSEQGEIASEAASG